MIGDSTYYDDTSTRVLALLRDTFGEQFKAYFDGEAEPSEGYLPCIIVSNLRSQVDFSATGTDVITDDIQIVLCRNLKDDLGAAPDKNLTEYILRKQVSGQDPVTKQYVPQSVLGALRTNITLVDSTIDTKVSINYTQNYRGNIAVREAYITLQTVHRVQVPLRT